MQELVLGQISILQSLKSYDIAFGQKINTIYMALRLLCLAPSLILKSPLVKVFVKNQGF